jgi:hypoxanthine phosphoribosyltransferase
MGGDRPKTEFCIFVLHVCVPPLCVVGQQGQKLTCLVAQNKDKPKKGILPNDMIAHRYEAAVTVGDAWINYPWEALDIDEHDSYAESNRVA